MGRTIEGTTTQGNFPPMVSLRTKGNFVKGRVTAQGTTAGGNPVVTLALIDLEGSTQRSVSKGVYEEVEVAQGDSVQVVGSVTDLREKLPQLAINDIVTITNVGEAKAKAGRQPKKLFKVEVA